MDSEQLKAMQAPLKHVLVRDGAYESMLKSRRQQLHLRLVGILKVSGAASSSIARPESKQS